MGSSHPNRPTEQSNRSEKPLFHWGFKGGTSEWDDLRPTRPTKTLSDDFFDITKVNQFLAFSEKFFSRNVGRSPNT